MKTLNNLLNILLVLVSTQILAQENIPQLRNYWQIGLGLGELPTGGSFKPSITIGYHFNEKIYAGIIYQLKDEISRGSSSFNAKSTDLEGLNASNETVSQRFLFQMRYTPVRKGPYLSGGFVFNGKDTETMQFDNRERVVAGAPFSGNVAIQQTRPAGWGMALGLGYQYDFKNGFSTGFEWTPAWGQYPKADYLIGGSSNLSTEAKNELETRMDRGFNNSVTNMYKVFHIGVAYSFN